MLQAHVQALANINQTLHHFLASYSNTKKIVYGFVEGIDDPSFYRGFIEQNISDSWEVELKPAGDRDKVLEIHSQIKWNRLSKQRIVFFVDRDLSVVLNETLKTDLNIYVTDQYSIENSIVNRGACDRILTEMCGLTRLNPTDKNRLLDLFDEQLNIFLDDMVHIMAWIVHWNQSGENPTLSNIKPKDLYNISNGVLQKINNPRSFSSVADYIHSQCSIIYQSSVNVSHIENDFKSNGWQFKFIRGKYVMWFLAEYCLSVHRGITSLVPSITKPPKMHVSFSQSTGVVNFATRVRVPKSLKKFINDTHHASIKHFEDGLKPKYHPRRWRYSVKEWLIQ